MEANSRKSATPCQQTRERERLKARDRWRVPGQGLASTMLVATAAVIFASRPAAQVPSFRSTSSDLVVLPATVTDNQGLFVSDLPAERFAVYDNGRRVPIQL